MELETVMHLFIPLIFCISTHATEDALAKRMVDRLSFCRFEFVIFGFLRYNSCIPIFWSSKFG